MKEEAGNDSSYHKPDTGAKGIQNNIINVKAADSRQHLNQLHQEYDTDD